MFDFLNSSGTGSNLSPNNFSSLDLLSALQEWNSSNGVLGTVQQELKEKSPMSWFGDKDNPGLLSTGIGMATDLANSWLAMQQLDLAKEQFGFQKEAFNKQYENQRTLTNSRLEDRQRARLSANPNAYQSVGDYMKQNGV